MPIWSQKLCIFLPPANSGCGASDQNVREDLLRGFCCNRCPVNPIIEFFSFLQFSIKLPRRWLVRRARSNQRRCSSVVWFSHHLSPLVGRRQHIVPPRLSPRQIFSTTVVQISCPAKLRDVHDERSPTDFCGQIPIDWWTSTMHSAP